MVGGNKVNQLLVLQSNSGASDAQNAEIFSKSVTLSLLNFGRENNSDLVISVRQACKYNNTTVQAIYGHLYDIFQTYASVQISQSKAGSSKAAKRPRDTDSPSCHRWSQTGAVVSDDHPVTKMTRRQNIWSRMVLWTSGSGVLAILHAPPGEADNFRFATSRV